MIWDPELEEMDRRRRFALGMGGEDSVARQHAAGRLTARERIALLLDEGTWRELGTFTGAGTYDADGRLVEVRPANTIIGTGRVRRRRVAIEADDYTIRGGSTEAQIAEKWEFINRYALEMRIPMIRLVENVGGSVRLLEKTGRTKIPGYRMWPLAEMLGYVPVVALVLGPAAGLGGMKAASSHFSVMVRGTSQVFAAGPPVARVALGRDIDKEELGGAHIHTVQSGVIDNAADSEEEAVLQAKEFLSYLPQSVYEVPPRAPCDDPPERAEEELASIIPRNQRQVYNARRLLSLVFDQGSLFEIAPAYGPSSITMLARLSGYPVGVIANDPFRFGGGLTRSAAEKVETFVDLCDTFHLPVVNFVDQPGTVIGLEAEREGAVRGTIRLVSAIEQSRVPWCGMIVRRLFGLAGTSYGRLQGVNLHYAWPSARWGSIPIQGGVRAAFRRELDALPAEEAAARLEELEAQYDALSSPFRTAEAFGVPEIIDPRRTRPVLCEWIEDAYAVLPEQLGPTGRTMRR